jgi:tRNA(Arg) A34 adenosine deaminase TadA
MLYGTCEWSVAASGARADVDRASSARRACDSWLGELRDAVAPITVGVYAVDIARSGARSAADVRSAFGANRFRLAALQRRVDPAHVFSRSYYPLVDRLATASGERGDHLQWSDAAAQARFMERAIELAVAAQRSGGASYGALIVDPRNGGRIVAEGANDAARNPIWHGEMAAIANLSALLDSKALLPETLGAVAPAPPGAATKKSPSSVYAVAPGLELYTTAEPCSMCMSAIAWSGFGKVVYGTSIPYLVAHGVRQIDIRAAAIEARSGVVTKGRGVVVEGGVLARRTDLLYVRREGEASHHGHHHDDHLGHHRFGVHDEL